MWKVPVAIGVLIILAVSKGVWVEQQYTNPSLHSCGNFEVKVNKGSKSFWKPFTQKLAEYTFPTHLKAKKMK